MVRQGIRATEALRVVLAELQVADVRSHTAMSIFTDLVNRHEFKPAALHENAVNTMLSQLNICATALQPVRKKG